MVRRITWVLVVLLSAVVLLGFYVYSQSGYSSILHATPASVDTVTTVVKALLALVCMVLGIVFGSVFSSLGEGNQPNETVDMLAPLRSPAFRAQFLRSMLVAPIVYAGVYSSTKQQPDLVVASLFAFQNGFFCEAIFRKVTIGQPPAPV